MVLYFVVFFYCFVTRWSYLITEKGPTIMTPLFLEVQRFPDLQLLWNNSKYVNWWYHNFIVCSRVFAHHCINWRQQQGKRFTWSIKVHLYCWKTFLQLSDKEKNELSDKLLMSSYSVSGVTVEKLEFYKVSYEGNYYIKRSFFVWNLFFFFYNSQK